YSNTMCDIMAYAFSEEHINEVMDDLLEISDPEQLYALELGITSEWARTHNFEESRQQIRDFAANREFYVMLDMILALNTPISMYDVSATCTEGAHVYLNSQRDTNRVVYGRYLTNCDVTISAEMFDGYEFVKWVINDVEYTTPEVTISSDMAKDGNVYAKLISEKKELLDESVKISEICTDENAGWIKLYNPNAEAVSVGGLYLSDDALTPTEWRIPDNTIPAGGELLIVMKNNKTQEALMQLQATFSLKKRETLTLSDRDGNIISAVAIPTLEEGERYVLQADGSFKVKKHNQ
ncbi:MAG: lamin tail domain-containing protein, partial [Oscillospiraceae bacterium]|nr:lamin tail domain-containing protein [Oscillospiraceae bacterium]